MVFESIVVDVLNRVLGSYFENLDTSQLRLGIWGGDAVLRDLILKTSAMDDLGLPFKVVYGKLGNLTMKIPWQSLYTAPVELDLKNLYLLVVPSYAVRYNEEQEEIAAQARKQAELVRIDELRKQDQSRKSGSEEPPVPDTFAEKLVTQVIKNVQIRIESIHIRYEDCVTIPKTPFAFGVVLKNLNVQTTDENYRIAIITETVQVIHKLAKLEGLSVYWNSKTTMISQMTDKQLMLQKLTDFVQQDALLTHVLGPISSEGKIQLTPSPERLKFAHSKFVVDVDMAELAIGLTDRQFQDATSLAEALDYMSRAQHYRKYRPNVTEHRGHYKEWWRFAYRCIVEEDVRRRRLNWDWHHIKTHRQLVKIYADAYFQKLMNVNKKPKPDVEAKIQQCEKALDVFNITLVRKQVEVLVERQPKKVEPEKKGWFSGWFGGGSSVPAQTAISTGIDIAKKFEEALTPEEKQKLYEAIDYTEESAPLDYPADYIAYKLKFHLHTLRCVVKNVTRSLTNVENILDLQIQNVVNTTSTRPYKNGLKVELSMGSIEAVGVRRHENMTPFLISSKSTGLKDELVSISFETNPLDSPATQKLKVTLAPVEMVYHSKTIIELVRCFTLPHEMQLSKLQAATAATINQWKAQSAAGLQHLIETRGEIDVYVNFKAPYLLIPQGGTLSKNGSVLIFDLGEINIKSKPRVRDRIDKKEQSKKTKEEIRQEVINKSYDSFDIILTDFQVLLALPGDNFRAAIQKISSGTNNKPSEMQLIQSKYFIVQFDQCLVQDDPELPKLKLSARLELLDLVIPENRLLELMKLLVTLPFPKTPPQTVPVTDLSKDAGLAESVAVARITYSELAKKSAEDSVAQFSELIVSFIIDSIHIRIDRTHPGPNHPRKFPLAEFQMQSLHAKLLQKTFSLGINISLGGLSLVASSHKAPGLKVGELYLLRTPMTQQQLFKLNFFSISSDCPPKFATKVKQSINVDVTTLDVILHQEALVTLINFANEIMDAFTTAAMQSDSASVMTGASSTLQLPEKKEDKKQLSKFEATRKAVAKKHQDSQDILLECTAKLQRLTVQLSTENKNILRLVLGKLEVGFEQKPKISLVTMELTEFDLLNLDLNGFYHQIISQQLDKVIHVQCELLEDGTAGDAALDVDKYDMKLKVETGSPRIVYLNPFLEEVMDFINKFQAAKEAVLDASSAAVIEASGRVEQAYSTGTRALIDISFKSPHIIIPRSAKSAEGFIAYLGHLRVTNSFKRVRVGEKVVMIDDISTILTDMKVSRIITDYVKQRSIVECSILDPVTLRLDLQRNLGVGICPELPAIEIKGAMESTSIQCSSEDYAVLMAALEENISNKGDVIPTPALEGQMTTVVELNTKALVSRQSSRMSDVIPSTSPSKPVTKTKSESDTVHTNFTLQLVMEQTKAVLYEGSSHLQGKTGMITRDEKHAFAQFAIASIHVGVAMYTNSNMDCQVRVGKISLEDVRPGRRKITNLIDQKAIRDGEVEKDIPESLVSVEYKVDTTSSVRTLLTVDVKGMSIVICLEYLLKLGAFFTPPSDFKKSTKSDTPDVSVQLQTTGARKPATISKVDVEVPIDEKIFVDSNGIRKPITDEILFSLGSTDLILVEDAERADTIGFLLNCELMFKQIMTKDKTNLQCSLENVRMSTCNYDPETRIESMAEVISPMTLTVVMNISKDNGMLIDVNCSDIFLRLTAGTLELLLKVLNTSIQTSSAEKIEEDRIDYTNVWSPKSNEETNFWFLNPNVAVEVGTDALSTTHDDTARLFETSENYKTKERLLFESGTIIITFETGNGAETLPVFLLESGIDMQAVDWSKQIKLTGKMKLDVAYYNCAFGVWEYIVEPVQTRHHGKISFRPYEVYFDYTTVECTNVIGKGESPNGVQSADGVVAETTDSDEKLPTYMSISLLSNDILEMTVTKAALDVIQLVSADFQEEVKSLVSKRDINTATYQVVNALGCTIQINCTNTIFKILRQGTRYNDALLLPGNSLNLSLADAFDMTQQRRAAILKEQEGREERTVNIIIGDYDFKAEVPVNKAVKRYFSLKKKTTWGGNYTIICEISVEGTSKILTVRSCVQIVNHLKIPVDVYYSEDSGNSMTLAGTAPASKTFNVPITGLYTESNGLYFAPQGFKATSLPYDWTMLLKENAIVTNQLLCRTKVEGSVDFHMKAVGEAKETLFEGTNRVATRRHCFYVHIKCPMILNNMLPVEIQFSLSHEFISHRQVEKGHSIQITDLSIDKKEDFLIFLRMPDYQGESWSCAIDMKKNIAGLSPWLFTCDRIKTNTLYLGIHKDDSDETLALHIYSPFWMINRTGLVLAYHAEDQKDMVAVIHQPEDNPILFSFRGKSFFTKKKAVVRVERESDWSTKFPVDVAGSCGSVTCKSPTQDFEIGIEITLTGWGLTKRIVFTPRYYLINQCSFIVEVTEAEKLESKMKILPNTCVPFWPKSATTELFVRVDNTNEFSKRFSYAKSDEVLLQLPNQYGGVYVDVHITEASHVITLTQFVKGHAAVLAINHTEDAAIDIFDKGIETSRRTVNPGTHQYITWIDPMGEKIITWSPVGSGHSYTDKLTADGFGSYKAQTSNGEEKQYQWVSFLDGLQRVLLFTADRNLISSLQASRDTEAPTAEYILMFHGLGLSLVDTSKFREIFYMRIASSDIIWESQKSGVHQRFKPFPASKGAALEFAYQNYLMEKEVKQNAKSVVKLDDGLEIDLVDMKVLKPYQRTLRRSFQNGIWLQYKTYPHTLLIHAKLNRIQIDNQLPDFIFRTVLAPVPPPKSVSNVEDIPKPFAEVSIMERFVEHSSVVEFKYFKVLVQEFQVKTDIHFINAVMELFNEDAETQMQRMVENFNKEFEDSSANFETFLNRHVVSQGQKNFYDFLHFSPLKIHLSFSMGGATQVSNSFLNLLITSLGVSVTEVQDVVFKLACMELQHLFLTRDQLYNEAYQHYKSQALRHLYVLVLGLDVIGNPYGLLVGFTQGVGAFFYEPFQGAIQGPGEFMEGLALGVKSLFGHTIGGMSGAMSKIAGTFGKGVAALTLDDEYQKKRRENISKRQTATDGFIQSGKGLVTGFVGGFTGFFTQPWKGARKEGPGGFIKGVGKGTIGLIAKPVTGVIDFTSGSFDAVKKATSVLEEVRRMRPPRYIPTNSSLRPYIHHEAEGINLLHELEKGKYATTDSYVAHAMINPHGTYVLLLTSRRMVYLKRIDVFGGWGIQWISKLEDLDGLPVLVEAGLLCRVRQHQQQSKILRCQKSGNIVIPLFSPDVCTKRNNSYFTQWLLDKIETAMKQDTGSVAGDSSTQLLNTSIQSGTLVGMAATPTVAAAGVSEVASTSRQTSLRRK